jgi:NAD(P)-dependent dehydrogenase (short-subunit alcohol dehydrogenase family)
MSLKDRTALVTGGSRGIGSAICLRLAREGAAVAVNYRERRREAEEIAEEITSDGGRAFAIQADVSDRAAVGEMVRVVASELGPVDILVNNAGLFRRGDLDDFDPSALEAMRRTNVDGLVSATVAVAEGMKARHWGRVVNLSSISAHGTTMAGTTFYAATKAAVAVLTRRFALELGPSGITVNAVAPGFIVTDMVYADRPPEEVEQLLAGIAAKSMVGRTGRPEDIANAVAFLVSEEASFITAQILTVDGGRTDYICHP